MKDLDRRGPRPADAAPQAGSARPAAPTPAVELQQAIALHRQGRAAEAEVLLTRLYQSHPNDPAVLQLLGLARSGQGALDEAAALLRRSLAIEPRQPHVHNNLGNVLRRQGHPGEAAASYRDALRLKPDYAEAHFNLGVALGELEDSEAAVQAFRAALKIRPEYVQAWNALGDALRRLREFGEAEKALLAAIRLQPGYAAAHHNLGLTRAQSGDDQGAERAYLEAIRLGLDGFQVHHNLANARAGLGRMDEAIAGYREAIARNPEFTDAHINLNNLLWEHGRTDEYLQSYEAALRIRPEAGALYAEYATALLRHERHAQADEVLRRGLNAAPAHPRLHYVHAQAMEVQGQMAGAAGAFERCVELDPGDVDYRIGLGRHLLTADEPEAALTHLDEAVEIARFHQLAWGYRGLAWRLLDDPRDRWLNDYEKFVRPYELPVPDGYRDLPSFLDELAATLEALHTAKNTPTYQTLRHGTQTAGALFRRREPVIRSLQESLRKCIADYAANLPEDPSHPLVARRAGNFEFSGSWSVRLRRSGFHTMHVHPMGWLSSAFYVRVPQVVQQDAAKAGWIKFGQPDIDVGEAGNARRFIQPREGTLVLFPSYMWHGTVPFETDDVRMTVAFDVVPQPDPAR